MRISMLLLTSALVLSGCSSFRRSADAEPAILPPGVALHSPDDEQENAAEEKTANVESEVAKLNTKIEALETKLAVLTHAFENFQAKKAQPQIQAEQEPAQTPALSVPVTDEAGDEREPREPHVKQISAAPVPPSRGTNAIENQFRKAMTEFQQGRYRESAQQFAALSQDNPNHLLSAHALYWAGESNARVQQWSGAIENWEAIEKNYPTSTYVPEALAGLAKAYEVQGNVAKARSYRETLTHAFPNSPVALAAASSGVSPANKDSADTVETNQEESEE